MLDRVSAPAHSPSIYLRHDLSLDRAAIFRRAHTAAKAERANQIKHYRPGQKVGGWTLPEPDSYRVIFAQKLRREMDSAMQTRANRLAQRRAKTDPAFRAARLAFAARVMGNGPI